MTVLSPFSTGTDSGLFVVGCPRSGTTFIQSILGAHRDVAAFTESHFFTTHMNARFGLYRVSAALPARIGAFLAENGLEALAPAVPEIPTGIMTFAAAAGVVAACAQVFAAGARLRGKPVWLEKTPHNLLRLPLLMRALPSARFIHIVRAPEPNIASLRLAQAQWSPRGAPSWEAAARIWREAALATLARPPGHLVIDYDELKSDRERVASALLGWLGLRVEGYDHDGFADAAARLVTERESWKSRNLGKEPPAAAAPPPPRGLIERMDLPALYEKLRGEALGFA